MSSWKTIISVIAVYQFSLSGIFGEVERRQTCNVAELTSFVTGLGTDCAARFVDLARLNVEVAMSGVISKARVDDVASRVCTKSCGQRVVDYTRENNCASNNIPQNLNLQVLCSMNATDTTGRRCIQIIDEFSPTFFTSGGCTPNQCTSQCRTAVNNYKNSLGCCFGTQQRSLTLTSTPPVPNCNIELGDSCSLEFSGSGGVAVHYVNQLLVLVAICLTSAFAFN